MKKYFLLFLIIFISIIFLARVAIANENWLLINAGQYISISEEENIFFSVELETNKGEKYDLPWNFNRQIFINQDYLDSGGVIKFTPLKKVRWFSIDVGGKMTDMSVDPDEYGSWTKSLKLDDLKSGDNYITLTTNKEKHLTEILICVVPADFIDSAEINSIRALALADKNYVYQEIPIDIAVAQILTPVPTTIPPTPTPIPPAPTPVPTQIATIPTENETAFDSAKYLQTKLVIGDKEMLLSEYEGVIVFSEKETKVSITFDQVDFQEYLTKPFSDIFMVLIAVDMRGNPLIPTPMYINNQECIYTPGRQLVVKIK